MVVTIFVVGCTVHEIFENLLYSYQVPGSFTSLLYKIRLTINRQINLLRVYMYHW